VDLGHHLFGGADGEERGHSVSAGERVRYKRLPGCRRGILRGASVWLGPDHLLLVRTWRFREDYKRFHLGEIQSIAVAEAPRFHLSTRSIGIAILWVIAFSIAATSGIGWARNSLWAVAGALIVTWIYVSAKCSCVCRIYTAVSGDELPSIYRTRTARKFMSRVEPQIVAAQGAMEEDWAEAVDARRIGPPEEGHGFGTQAPSSLAAQNQGRLPPLAELFVAIMFADAALTYFVGKHPSVGLTRLGYGVLAVEIGLSVALLILHYRGRLLAGMQKLVIVSILATGVTWYAQPMIQAVYVAGAVRAGRPATAQAPATAALHTFDIGAHLLWGIWGLGVLLTQRERKPRAIITE
jgi:hypothetical protein